MGQQISLLALILKVQMARRLPMGSRIAGARTASTGPRGTGPTPHQWAMDDIERPRVSEIESLYSI